MPINFSNINTIWASVLVETLHCLGLETAVICPGSRSAPLTIAFAQHESIEAIPILDERSAAFFALGVAKRTGIPTVLVCTSGTAGANFYPAVIEARESQVPLLILTADRPPELRDCNAGQAIDQQKLYGSYPNWYHELATPVLDITLLSYVRQTVIHAWEQTLDPVPGCVHLNIPLRDPLVPIPQSDAQTVAQTFDTQAFFSGVRERRTVMNLDGSAMNHVCNDEIDRAHAGIHAGIKDSLPSRSLQVWLQTCFQTWFQAKRGILIAGVDQPRSPQSYCEAVAHLSKTLGFPVLAEGLSPLRNHASLNPYLVSTYDLILRNPEWAEVLMPEVVIRVGDMPTSKILRQWLARSGARQWIIHPGDRNRDPLHLPTTHLRSSVEQIAALLPTHITPPHPYLNLWCELEDKTRQSLDTTLEAIDGLFEGKVAWWLSQYLPHETPLFIANSTPVRDVEWFWKPGERRVQPFFNRGANGIDGTLSTALGITHHQRGVLLTGDLALLHDTNGFLVRSKFQGHLTIVLINNNGGGIFGLLPISQFDPPFEEFFATPQAIDFAPLCATYGVEHELMTSWEQLQQRVSSLPMEGIRVLEVRCDRNADAQWRQGYFKQFSQDR